MSTVFEGRLRSILRTYRHWCGLLVAAFDSQPARAVSLCPTPARYLVKGRAFGLRAPSRRQLSALSFPAEPVVQALPYCVRGAVGLTLTIGLVPSGGSRIVSWLGSMLAPPSPSSSLCAALFPLSPCWRRARGVHANPRGVEKISPAGSTPLSAGTPSPAFRAGQIFSPSGPPLRCGPSLALGWRWPPLRSLTPGTSREWSRD